MGDTHVVLKLLPQSLSRSKLLLFSFLVKNEIISILLGCHGMPIQMVNMVHIACSFTLLIKGLMFIGFQMA